MEDVWPEEGPEDGTPGSVQQPAPVAQRRRLPGEGPLTWPAEASASHTPPTTASRAPEEPPTAMQPFASEAAARASAVAESLTPTVES